MVQLDNVYLGGKAKYIYGTDRFMGEKRLWEDDGNLLKLHLQIKFKFAIMPKEGRISRKKEKKENMHKRW